MLVHFGGILKQMRSMSFTGMLNWEDSCLRLQAYLEIPTELREAAN